MEKRDKDYQIWLRQLCEFLDKQKPRTFAGAKSKSRQRRRYSKWCHHMVVFKTCQYGDDCDFVHHFAEFQGNKCFQDKTCQSCLCPWVHTQDRTNKYAQYRQIRGYFNAFYSQTAEKQLVEEVKCKKQLEVKIATKQMKPQKLCTKVLLQKVHYLEMKNKDLHEKVKLMEENLQNARLNSVWGYSL